MTADTCADADVLIDTRLSIGARLLYAILRSQTPTDYWHRASMAKMVGVSKVSISRYLRELADAGLIGHERHGSKGNQYMAGDAGELSPVMRIGQELSPVITLESVKLSPVIRTGQELSPVTSIARKLSLVPSLASRASFNEELNEESESSIPSKAILDNEEIANKVSYTDALAASANAGSELAVKPKRKTKDIPRVRREPHEIATWMPDKFAAAWSYYGKVGNVIDAAAAWDKLQPTLDDMRVMKLAITNQRSAYGWGEAGGQGQPYFSTFIRSGAWLTTEPTPTRYVNGSKR